MQRALQLAALGQNRTSPNPLVGAVVINESGFLVGEGFHARAGLPHAEVGALNQAGDQAKGGTLVVTLEPCCHQGRTPPCTDLVLSSGLRRVVVALQDPDSRVSGAGLERLRDGGLEVITGVLEDLAVSQNKAFIHRIRTGLPLGIMKWAMSFDGRTSLPNGASKWITNEKSRDWVHSLRAKVDAVIVGGETVRRDDPLLTSRGKSTPEPIRVVFSRSLDLPENSRIWDTSISRTLIAYGPEVPKKLLSNLPKGPGKIKLRSSEPIDLLHSLAEMGCNSVLWECGPKLASIAIKQGCVQEIAMMLAPKLLGGVPAGTPLSELGLYSVEDAFTLKTISKKTFGQDLLVRALLE
ncbi:bifunctional diaminohydroxyphosphoribosylaminopyrimidine deaminase/5-amino-6-(5-phosphoribosylamino)uracil reductase RibD [Prochlorococcus sp. MIT 1341]|uniref:bifunctional diaminohydroxyphosphoribosylaminopyrimidine deaminase/5-amino-6-(5-phosphoribosylamino)uracil reductase RibD n=1 Tax=Prochlorococcus sp. MIT 1341 TaxID=3096221 RepID=UPI002A747630|nr:bifunctional diaminohydroxyphosphoribosylaminopyrimidine deaminase/5-amino-6-(5-phosphoribosylamino)uracil reductase RibD [Prochlorococcus sp. MIT 1341]